MNGQSGLWHLAAAPASRLSRRSRRRPVVGISMPGWAQPWRLAPRRVQSPMAVSTLPPLWIRTISRATIRPCRCLSARWDFWPNEALQRTHRNRHAPERGSLGGRYGGTGRSVDRQDLQPVPRFILPGAPEFKRFGPQNQVLGLPMRLLRGPLSTVRVAHRFFSNASSGISNAQSLSCRRDRACDGTRSTARCCQSRISCAARWMMIV